MVLTTTEYLESVEKKLEEEVSTGVAQQFGNGVIRRVDEGQFRKGYRFENVSRYAFYDVYWSRVSDHFLIQEQYRARNTNWRISTQPKPIFGPIPLEILDSDSSEDSIDQRCLQLLKDRVQGVASNESRN